MSRAAPGTIGRLLHGVEGVRVIEGAGGQASREQRTSRRVTHEDQEHRHGAERRSWRRPAPAASAFATAAAVTDPLPGQ
jgi:hypothetical protein